MSSPKSLRVILAITAAAALTALLVWHLAFRAIYSNHATFTRIDGRYRIEVLRMSTQLDFSMMPGQSADSPGRVRLVNAQGQVLKQADVEMLQWVDKVEWTPKKVSIPTAAIEWPLPQ